jgi:hypothetical protein
LTTTGRVRSSIGSAGPAMLFAVTGAVLLGAAVLVAFLLRPPLLGWVGFAVVCAIVIGLATFAAIAFPRLRVSPQQPAAASDANARLLVVAGEHCGSPGLWHSIESRVAGAVAIHLVVPVRVSHLHYLTNDEASESRDAVDRVDLAVGLLRQHGVSVTGGIGSDDPLESMTDALGSFPATRILLATSTVQDSYWLEHDLLAKAQTLTSLEVSHVGDKIGKLEDVYVDVETDEPIFGTVKEGMIGRHLTFVPLGGITIGPDNLQVPVSGEQVKAASEIALDVDELSQRDESDLYHHYQLNYTPPATESGRRLARR